MYREDSYNAGDLKVCPKITHRHIYPSNMDKMRVKLATQIFSRSMAGGLEYYHGRNVTSLWNCAGTIEFTLRLNDLFDALN